jgi:hypothetical protein
MILHLYGRLVCVVEVVEVDSKAREARILLKPGTTGIL